MDSKRVKHLVVDSGAFIKNSPVHEYAENVYTVDGAVKEIKDKATLQRLQFLPYTLHIKDPSPDAYKYVFEFSKKTGDYSNLSLVDLQILALTYQLEKEHTGTDHLNKEPSCQVTGKPAHIDVDLIGFYYPKEKSSKKSTNTDVEIECNTSEEVKKPSNGDIFNTDIIQTESNISNKEVAESSDNDSRTEQNEEVEEEVFENAKSEISSDEDYESVSNGDEKSGSDADEESGPDADEESGPDADSWITPSNIAKIQKKMKALALEQSSVVACVTTDFSVQNVLIQMGVNVVSVDGMLIKKAKVFILRCHACFKTTNDITKKFCPNCGNKTLKRVAVTVNEDGTKNIHINFRKPINIRGKRFSLPTPKGGKHSFNPIVCEDQPIPQNRLCKAALQKTNPWCDNYDALDSPFARNDVYSRSANLNIHVRKNFNRRNPNDWSKRTGNKKRK